MKGTGPVGRPPTAAAPRHGWVPASLPSCPQALRVNGLEQLCNNLASERLKLFCSQMLLAQEEVGGLGRDVAGGHQLCPKAEAISGKERALH